MSGKDVPKDPDELRADVERTRRDLGDTVEALVHKTDVPGRVKEKAHEGVEQVKETATRANAAVSAVAGKTTTAISHAADKAGEQVGKAGAVATQVGEKAGAVATQVGHKASEVAGQVGEKAAHAVEALPPPVQQRVERGVRQARRHPGAVTAGAVAVVLLLWRLLRGRRSA